MAVLATTTWKVHPGKMQDFIAHVTEAKKMIERHGAKLRLLARTTGTDAPCHVTAVEYADWNAFGEQQAKMQGDAQWMAFLQKIGKEPAAVAIATGLAVEVPLG